MFRKLLVLALAILFIAGMATKADALYGLSEYWFSVVDEDGQTITTGYGDIDILIYDTGTSDKATIYSDDIGTSKSQSSAWNPTSSGKASFYSSASSVDIVVVNDDAFTVKVVGATLTTHRIQVRDIATLTGLDSVAIGAGTADTGSFTTLVSVLATPIAYKVPYEVAATGDTVTAAETGKRFITTSDATFTLPAAALGLEYTFTASDTLTVNVDPASTADTIVYLGLDAGDKITSPGATSDSVTIVCGAANTWYIVTMNGTWTDGGA